MFFELTDLLTCPRCGPAHGLVLLASEVEDRRVRSGWLGCPNCRTDYPVEGGEADLRLVRDGERVTADPYDEEELAVKILALSGLGGRRGLLALDERLAHLAEPIAAGAPELEVVAIGRSTGAHEIRPGVNRVLCDEGWPLADHRCECVAVVVGGEAERLADAARIVAAGGRLLMFDAADAELGTIERTGLKLLAAEGGTAVAERQTGGLPIVR